VEKANAGDVYFIPAGRVHAIGKGILLAEIQQTSDITYRIYDWDRVDSSGKSRELHNDLALEVIDFNAVSEAKLTMPRVNNKPQELVSCDYFAVNRLEFANSINRNYDSLDSFVIYICLKGKASIIYRGDESVEIMMGESVLIPAELKDIVLKPEQECGILEIFVK
jgi:mannose-6-phosphate isomerase